MGFGKDGKGIMISEKRGQALGALATDTAIIVGTKLAITEDFRMLKNELLSFISGLTAGEGLGLWLGIAQGGLTLSEIEGAIESNGPLDDHNMSEEEVVLKPVWVIGRIEKLALSDVEAIFVDAMTGSPLITSKHRWTYGDNASGWNYFVYNLGVALTSGSTIKLMGRSFGVWVH